MVISEVDGEACGWVVGVMEVGEDWVGGQLGDLKGVDMVSCRIPAHWVDVGMELQEAGFRHVETVVDAVRATERVAFLDCSLELRNASPGDCGWIGDIAGSAFTTDRFTVDNRIPRGASGKRYRRFAEQAVRSGNMLKVVAGDNNVGFISYEDHGDTRRLVLTAIARQFQSQSYGWMAWRKLIWKSFDEGKRSMTATISTLNMPALNLYTSLGFRFSHPQSTYHWIRP